MLRCLHCDGTLVRKKMSYTMASREHHLIIDDMPAWVCQQCGEPMFEEQAVDVVQKLLHELDLRKGDLQP
jgi:YgiT-type zinc finger domain-containing protein